MSSTSERTGAGLRLPWWAAVLDVAGTALLVLACLVAIAGRFSISAAGVHLFVSDPLLLLLIAAALIAVRHAARPAPPLHGRLRGWVRRGLASAPRRAMGLALATRLAVLLVGYVAVLTIGLSPSTTGFQLSSDPLLNLPARFDAGWYAGIALDGYYYQHRFDVQQNIAFFPAFPLLLRATGPVVGATADGLPRDLQTARLLWGGLLLSIAAFLWAAHYLVRLARDDLGAERAMNLVALISAYPFAVFFSAPYTESLFLLGSVATFYHFRRALDLRPAAGEAEPASDAGRHEGIKASLWGLLVGLTRPNGFLLSVPLGLIALAPLLKREHRRPPRDMVRALGVAAMPGLGMLAHSAYIHQLTGTWFGWAKLQSAWGREFAGLEPVSWALSWIGSKGLLRVAAAEPFNALNALGLIFVLALLWPVFRRVGLPWLVFVVLNVAPPLLAGGVLSMGRLTSTLFPLFLALAAILPPGGVTACLVVFAALQGLVAALFFTWRPMF